MKLKFDFLNFVTGGAQEIGQFTLPITDLGLIPRATSDPSSPPGGTPEHRRFCPHSPPQTAATHCQNGEQRWISLDGEPVPRVRLRAGGREGPRAGVRSDGPFINLIAAVSACRLSAPGGLRPSEVAVRGCPGVGPLVA